MTVVRNKDHTIIEVAPKAVRSYSRYRVWKKCLILGIKDEVKHPTAKREILKLYGFA